MKAMVWKQSGFIALGGNRKESWQVAGAMCNNCAGTIMACDSLDITSDYEWFCVNEGCENHSGTRTYDTEKPDWVDILR